MSRWPAIVREVDRPRREIRVEIPGVTDGAQVLPLAEIEYPIGDRSARTEIRMSPGDEVWVEFIAGDPRYPLITGYRAKHTGNSVGTRRWQHDNIEMLADTLFRVIAGEFVTLVVGDSHITIDKNGQVTVKAPGGINGDTPGVTVVGNVMADGTIASAVGASGSFTTPTGLTVTVQSGLVTNMY